MTIERQIRPEDVVCVLPEYDYVGLRTSEIFGEKASLLYGSWAVYSGIEGCEDFYDPVLADQAAIDFCKITGFSPLAVALELYVARERLGLSTSRII